MLSAHFYSAQTDQQILFAFGVCVYFLKMCNTHEPSTSQINQRVLYTVDVFSITTFYILLLKSHSFQDRMIPDHDMWCLLSRNGGCKFLGSIHF